MSKRYQNRSTVSLTAGFKVGNLSVPQQVETLARQRHAASSKVNPESRDLFSLVFLDDKNSNAK